MKGVVVAAGRGTRLRPVTRVVNKHLLPVFDEPMIYYPVKTLLDMGVDDVLVICPPNDVGRYSCLLEPEFDADFHYRVQREANGIAHALRLVEDFVNDTVAVVLGDNVVFGDLSGSFASFARSDESARIFLTEVENPSQYGVVEFDDGSITRIVEKPDDPPSKYAVIGLYLYTTDLFDVIPEIEESERGEYEITDVNSRFLSREELGHDFLVGEWFDVGTPERLLEAGNYVRDRR